MHDKLKFFQRTLVASLALALLAMPVLAIEYGGLGGRPASPDPDNPRSQSIFLYELEAGATADDELLVSNNSSEDKTVEVYAVDGQTTNTGSFACRQKVEPREGVGSWIEFDTEQIELASGSQETVGFNVSMPDNVDVGEHNGCIIIAEVNPDTEETEGGVALSFRSGLRVAVTVPGDIIKELEFTGMDIERGERPSLSEQAHYTITPQLENSGNVSLDTTVTAEMNPLIGETLSNGGTFPVLSQDELHLNLSVTPSFWGGLYRVSTDATYNENPETRLGQGDEEDLITITTSAGWMFVPPTPMALIIILGVLLTLIAIVIFWLWRKGKVLNPGKDWDRYEVKGDESIQAVARKHNISWKKLARANKLKAPYSLEDRTSIKVPPQNKSKKPARKSARK